MYVVTGGAGYFGQVIVKRLLERGNLVNVLDLNEPGLAHPRLKFSRGDIRDLKCVQEAMFGASVVFHCVAQVPLAKDKNLFWSVNRDGTHNILQAAVRVGVQRVVYISSSAVFGVPKSTPVKDETEPSPMEEYGRAKLAGERLCRDYLREGLNVVIVRPRTIVGHGRLGIFQVLFEWIYNGRNVPVLGRGNNLYQFVHSEDLASAVILAEAKGGIGEAYNIGAADFGTMRSTLEKLVVHAGTKSRVKSVPKSLAVAGMHLASDLGFSPLAPYHALMYGESMYFEGKKAELELGFKAHISQDQMIAESYDWYVANRDRILAGAGGRSHHQSTLRQGLLALVPYFI